VHIGPAYCSKPGPVITINKCLSAVAVGSWSWALHLFLAVPLEQHQLVQWAAAAAAAGGGKGGMRMLTAADREVQGGSKAWQRSC
jgi:hypothetical protein